MADPGQLSTQNRRYRQQPRRESRAIQAARERMIRATAHGRRYRLAHMPMRERAYVLVRLFPVTVCLTYYKRFRLIWATIRVPGKPILFVVRQTNVVRRKCLIQGRNGDTRGGIHEE
jgi:hypothetical protein